MGKCLFVTVGTTKFDALIAAVDQEEFGAVLLQQGFAKLLMQVGKGAYKPRVLCAAGKQHDVWRGQLQVDWFDFAPNLQVKGGLSINVMAGCASVERASMLHIGNGPPKANMRAADVILSHAGSGSLFEALALEKPTVAVPNPILMHNHQEQLARHLADKGYLWCSKTDGLVETFQRLDTTTRKTYAPGDAVDMLKRVDTLMGFS